MSEGGGEGLAGVTGNALSAPGVDAPAVHISGEEEEAAGATLLPGALPPGTSPRRLKPLDAASSTRGTASTMPVDKIMDGWMDGWMASPFTHIELHSCCVDN